MGPSMWLAHLVKKFAVLLVFFFHFMDFLVFYHLTSVLVEEILWADFYPASCLM